MKQLKKFLIAVMVAVIANLVAVVIIERIPFIQSADIGSSVEKYCIVSPELKEENVGKSHH